MLRTFVLLACGAVLGSTAPAQEPRPHTAASRVSPAPARPSTGANAYATVPGVTERLDTVYRYNADGTGTKLDSATIHVQGDAALRRLSVLSVPYAAGRQHVEFVTARVHKPNGTIVNTPVSEAQDQPTPFSVAAPAFSDTHVALLPIRGLALGDRLEYGIRTVTTSPEAGGHFWAAETFGHGSVVLERSVELHVPSSRYVQVVSPAHAPEVTTEGTERVYRWSGAQLQPIGANQGAGTLPNEDIDDGKPPIAWTTFHDWAELGEWYRSRCLDALGSSPSLKSKADQLTFNSSTPQARVDALYRFVSHEIRSIEVPLGEGAWTPHPAADTLNDLLGDTQDKAVLLASMLQAEHLPAALALLPAQDVDESVPAPLWFRRIGVVFPGTPATWLDPVLEVAEPGVLQGPFRNRLALVLPLGGQPALQRTPADLPYAAQTRYRATGTLSTEGALEAHIDLLTRGDEELNLRETAHNIGQGQWDRLGSALARLYGLPGDVTDTALDQPEQTTQPLHLSFQLATPHIAEWDGLRVPSLLPSLSLPFADRKTYPGSPVDLGGKRSVVATAELHLPAGFRADPPSPLHIQSGLFDLDQTYKVDTTGDGHSLVAERTFSVHVDHFGPENWSTYRHLLEEIDAATAPVQLTGIEAPGHPAETSLAIKDDPKAAESVRLAGDAIRRGDWDAARTLLEEAQGRNPQQAYLWSGSAALARHLGQPQETIEDERRELAAHPGEAAVAHQLALDLNASGQSKDAMEVLKSSLKLNPRDERATLLLASLQSESDPASAEATLRPALAASPDSLALKLALGRVCLQLHKQKEATELLTAVLNASQDPGELNNAAFALADAGLDLRTAELASRRGLRMLIAGSVRGEDRGHPEAQVLRSAALASTWDTYGWILFKEGLTTEAELWLRAAWTDTQDAQSGSHLAALLQKQGRTAEAAAILHLIQEKAVPSPTSAARHFALSQDRGHAAGLPLTSIEVPRSSGIPPGNADFLFDLSLGAPQSAQFLHGDEALAPMEFALAKVDTHTIIPPGTSAHLYRLARLHCDAGAVCTLELLPLGSESAR